MEGEGVSVRLDATYVCLLDEIATSLSTFWLQYWFFFSRVENVFFFNYSQPINLHCAGLFLLEKEITTRKCPWLRHDQLITVLAAVWHFYLRKLKMFFLNVFITIKLHCMGLFYWVKETVTRKNNCFFFQKTMCLISLPPHFCVASCLTNISTVVLV